MNAKKYKIGHNRTQSDLLPPTLDDYVSELNPVRAIDAYVDSIDLESFTLNTIPKGALSGQPAYPPKMYIKLYLYGYINSIRSSRKLEREGQRNLEVMWLVSGLKPSYKSIANFRKDNSKALKEANKDFMLLCKQLALFAGESVAVDGSFFKADASKEGIYTQKKLDNELAELEKKLDAYEAELNLQDAKDDQNGLGSLLEDTHLSDKIKKLKEKLVEKKSLQKQLNESKSTQISTIDEDARYLTKNGKSVAGYNVQIAVDSQYKLIVAQEVTQDNSDIKQLVPMLEKAQNLLDADHLIGIADAGYYSREQIKLADEKGFEIYVPVPRNDGNAINKGVFARDKFIYDETNNCYICPNEEQIKPYGSLVKRDEHFQQIYRSKSTVCNGCPLRTKCLGEKSSVKMIVRWEHEHLVEKHKKQMKNSGVIMRKRSGMVEHPFGTLKHRAGMHHFLMRGLEKCRGEFSLMTLCYNFTRVINILGVNKLRDYCVQRHENRENLLKIA